MVVDDVARDEAQNRENCITWNCLFCVQLQQYKQANLGRIQVTRHETRKCSDTRRGEYVISSGIRDLASGFRYLFDAAWQTTLTDSTVLSRGSSTRCRVEVLARDPPLDLHYEETLSSYDHAPTRIHYFRWDN